MLDLTGLRMVQFGGGGTFTTFICCYESAILSGVLSFLLVGLDCLFSKQLL